MHPDLTYGKGPSTSPTLGINRRVLCSVCALFGVPHPSAEVKSLVEISLCSRVSFFDTDNPSHVPNARDHILTYGNSHDILNLYYSYCPNYKYS